MFWLPSGIYRQDHLACWAAVPGCLRDLPARAAMAAMRNTAGASADPASTVSRNCPGWGLGYPRGTYGALRRSVLARWCQWKISRPRQTRQL